LKNNGRGLAPVTAPQMTNDLRDVGNDEPVRGRARGPLLS